MSTTPGSAADKIPAEIFGSFCPGEIKINLHTATGQVQIKNVPVQVVACELRMPNTKVWVSLDENGEVVGVWDRN